MSIYRIGLVNFSEEEKTFILMRLSTHVNLDPIKMVLNYMT